MSKTGLKPREVKGLRRRWMQNSVLFVSVALSVLMVAFIVSSTSIYYSSIRIGLEAKAKTTTGFFTNYITKTYAEYYDSVYRYTETFDESNKLELQFLDTDRKIIISTNGMTAGSSVETSDVIEAAISGKISSWRGKNPQTGERIMSVSAPIMYSNNQMIGIMRYVTSLKLVDNQVLFTSLVACSVGLIFLLLLAFTNLVFIRSVIEPVGEITQAAKRMADGSYGVQINREYRDEIGEMVNAINEMSMKIARSEKIQTEFISSVSHELRTPLTAITGWGMTLIYDDSLDEETRRGIGIILREAERLTKMVEELLEFTRIQDGRFTLNMEQIDLIGELEDSIYSYRELIRQDEMNLEYEPTEEILPMMPGDPSRLRQVFWNLFDNATKYGREGKRILVTVEADNSNVMISVRDFGTGVPEDEVEHLKKKFFKGSNARVRGSGIGLAVCDEIIRFHGGRLDIDNAEGGGLVATISLPINDSVTE